MRLIGEKQFNGFGQFLAQVGAEGHGADDPDWYEPLVDPRGVIHCVRVPIAGHRRPKGAHGLVPAHKLANRYGLRGASPHARKAIGVTARCLNRFHNRVAFGGFTPSPDDMDAIEYAPGGASGFQRRLGQALSHLLQGKGFTPLWALIPEVTPRLSRLRGRPAIHWHFLALCKSSRYAKHWWLSKDDWKAVFDTAYRWHVGHDPIDARASTKVVMARNPARYLSKYLTKGMADLEGIDCENHQDALPRQWQSRSAPMRRMVEFYTGRLPSSFADFLNREWQLLEGLKLGYCCFWHPPSCDRYEILTFYPNSIESLMLVWERYMAWRSSDMPAPGFHSSDQELAASLARRAMEIHQEGGEPVVSDRVGPLQDLRAPDLEQPNLLKWRLYEAQHVSVL